MYSFDFMGATEQSRSGNDVLAMSPFTEKDDLDAVLTMIRGQQFVDTQNIFLMPVWPAATTSSIPPAGQTLSSRVSGLRVKAFRV